MKYLLLLLSTVCIFLSCEKSNLITNDVIDTEMSDSTNIEIPEIKERCFEIESIVSNTTGFVIADKGLQLDGFAKGTKINKEWEASALATDTYSEDDDAFWLTLITYWKYPDDDNYYAAEFISIGPINKNVKPDCYNLTSGQNSENMFRTYYKIQDYDITFLDYVLNDNAENVLEIIDYNEEEGKLIGKFKATYITDNPTLPYFPETVRFFNVDIEIGN